MPPARSSAQRYSLGGAGNVVINLVALGVTQVHALGVVGDDPCGQEMRRMLQAQSVDTPASLVQADAWNTHVYTKPYIQDQEQNRIDFGNFNRLADATAARLLAGWRRRWPRWTWSSSTSRSAASTGARFPRELGALIRANPGRTFLLDSRHYSDAYAGTVRKLNDHEAARLCGIERTPDGLVRDAEARQAADELFRRWGKPVVVTRGGRGCLVAEAAGARDPRPPDPGPHRHRRRRRQRARRPGRSPRRRPAARWPPPLGNFVAGVTVQMLFQTGTASPGGDPDDRARARTTSTGPELAEDPRQARFTGGHGDRDRDATLPRRSRV